jgi:Domain of unknown function (DUF4115)
MVLIVVISGLIVVVGLLLRLRRRGRVADPVVRHERALAALRELAEHPHACEHEAVAVEPVSVEHIHILEEPPPAAVAARARRPRRTTSGGRRPTTPRRRSASAVAALPTVAQLPTLAHSLAPPRTEPIVLPRPGSSDEGAGHGTKPAEPAPIEQLDAPEAEPTAGHASAVRERVLVVGTAMAVCLAIVAIALFTQAPSTHRTQRRAVRQPASVVPPPRTVVTAPRVTTPRAPDLRLAVSAGGNGTVAIGAPFTLAFVPKADCWISVRTGSGQAVFEGTLHAGQRQQLTGSAPLVVRIGNTPVLTMEVNGTQLDLSQIAHTANVQFVTG